MKAGGKYVEQKWIDYQYEEAGGNSGVSPGTVSLVLGGKGDELRIAKLTQEKILETAVQYGYRAPEGRSTGQGKRWRIYVFCPFEERVKVINGRNVYGLHQAILEEHLEVDISLQPYIINRLEECKNLFSPKYCDGIIVSGLGEQDMNFLTRFKFDVPVVLFNRPNERYSSVYVDNYEAGRRTSGMSEVSEDGYA